MPKLKIVKTSFLGETYGQRSEEDGRNKPEHLAHVRRRVRGHAAPASRQDLHVQAPLKAGSARVHLDPHPASPQKDRNEQTQEIA